MTLCVRPRVKFYIKLNTIAYCNFTPLQERRDLGKVA